MAELDCSVVIPTFGHALSLEATLKCLQQQTLPSDHFEVIVVDNNADSTDSTRVASIASHFDVRLVSASSPGPAAARNAGIRAARGRIVVFVDDDVEFDHGFLEAHLEAHEASPAGVAAGQIVEFNEHSRWFRRYLVDRRVVPDRS